MGNSDDTTPRLRPLEDAEANDYKNKPTLKKLEILSARIHQGKSLKRIGRAPM